MKSTQIKLLLGLCFVGMLVFLFTYRKSAEGFKNISQSEKESEEKKSWNPDVASYELLTSVMKPLRRLTKIVLDPSNWKDRVTMATMSPTELARMYLNSQKNQTTE
jgi:hypothetical protein